MIRILTAWRWHMHSQNSCLFLFNIFFLKTRMLHIKFNRVRQVHTSYKAGHVQTILINAKIKNCERKIMPKGGHNDSFRIRKRLFKPMTNIRVLQGKLAASSVFIIICATRVPFDFGPAIPIVVAQNDTET